VFYNAVIRSYDSLERVTRYEERYSVAPDFDRADYLYNTQGLPSQVIRHSYNSVANTWTENRREHLYYDLQGFLIHDSMSIFNGTGWMPNSSTDYVSNAAGYPTIITVHYFGNGMPAGLTEISYDYNSSNQRTRRIIRELSVDTVLENYSKDSAAYVGGMRTYRSFSYWISPVQDWQKVYEEFRHLNGAGLPDSVWGTDYFLSPNDSFYKTLDYNAAGLPVRQYISDNGGGPIEERYYYETYDLGIGSMPTAGKLFISPNPASGILRVSAFEKAAGRIVYRIFSPGGQLLRSVASYPGSGAMTLDISGLLPGSYLITAQDERGSSAAAQFVKP
jgi:hypothetical protein